MNLSWKNAVRFSVLSALLLAFCVCSWPSYAQAPSEIQLVNPGFEGDYVTVPGGYAAPGWVTHYTENARPPLAAVGGGSDPTRRPEFKPIDASQYPERVAEGERAQVAFAFYGIMDAAFSQQVSVERGRDLRCSIDAHGWSTNTDDPSQHSGDVWISVGIGAEGQTDPWEHGIEWTRWDWTAAEYRTYQSRVVTAESERVTLFVRVTNKWSVKHNDAYIDAARCWYVDSSGTIPTPEPQPTPTPCPTCPPCEPGTCNEQAIAQAVVDALHDWFAGLRWSVVD